MVDLRKRFGNLVAAHRRRRGLTQEALANEAEISVEMISKLEGGGSGASFDTIEKLASVLNVDPAELFTTELPSATDKRPDLHEFVSTIAKLSDADLKWVRELVGTALRKPR